MFLPTLESCQYGDYVRIYSMTRDVYQGVFQLFIFDERRREGERERGRETEREGVHYFGAEPLGLCRVPRTHKDADGIQRI